MNMNIVTCKKQCINRLNRLRYSLRESMGGFSRKATRLFVRMKSNRYKVFGMLKQLQKNRNKSSGRAKILFITCDAHIKEHDDSILYLFSRMERCRSVAPEIIDLSAFSIAISSYSSGEKEIASEDIISAVEDGKSRASAMRSNRGARLQREIEWLYKREIVEEIVRRVNMASSWELIESYKSQGGLDIGHTPALEAILRTKRRLCELSQDEVRRYKWCLILGDLAESTLTSYVGNYQGIECGIFYNDYTIQQIARLWLEKRDISAVKIAGIPGNSFSPYKINISNMYGIEESYTKRVLWQVYRKEAVQPWQVKWVYSELEKRLVRPSIHTYSPTEITNERIDLRLRNSKDKPIITLFTSSPEEYDKDVILATKSIMRFPTKNGRYNSHDDLLKDFVELAREYMDRATFIIRIHPRSGKNRRDDVRSTYLK